jgi:hypothetical protein
MISSKPKLLDPQGKLFSVFNVSNFYSNHDFVTESRLMEYSNLYSKNIFFYLNSFMNGITFEVSINGITKDIFSLVSYLPNIIFEMSNVSYDQKNNSTNIIGNSWFENSSVGYNLNIGSNLNVRNILTQKLTSDIISCNTLNCTNLSINGQNYNETVGVIYLNGISLPIQKSNLISNFNISPITSFYFTLYSYTNTSNDYIYYQQIVFNINMKKNIYI